MKKIVAIAAALTLTSVTTLAQASDPFAGFSAELSAAQTSYKGTISNFAVNGAAIPTTTLRFNDIDKSKTAAGLVLRYTAPISETMYLGLSYERSLQDAKLGGATAVLNGVTVTAADSVSVKNQQALVLSPSYKLSDSALIALRVGYVQSTTDIASTGEPTDSIKASGTLIGLGLRYAVTSSIYISGAYDVYNYSTESKSGVDSDGDTYAYNFKPEGSAFTVSVGYRF